MKKRLKKSRKILRNEELRQFFKLKFIFIYLFIIFLPVLVEGAICTTTVPAGLVVGETWTAAGSPYCVGGDIQVSLLTIEPGVEVLVDGPYEIEVLSTITAIGTEADPILFSANLPEEPDNQRWKGIKFQNTPSGSNFTYVIIEYSDNAGITILNSSPPIFSNCTIQNNSRNGHGGGISAVGITEDIEFQNCTFFENTSSQHGGALHVILNEGFALTIADSTFENNTANPSRASGNYVGGALYLEEGDALISNSRFMGNRSNSRCSSSFGCNVTARGGAIYIGGSGNIEISNTELVGNQSDALNQGSCFFGGSSNSFGGGVYVNSGTVTLTNDILACNTTTRSSCGASDGGGGLYVNGGSVTVDNNTIARNADATGVHLQGGTLDIMNSIINSNNSDGLQVGDTPVITYSLVQGGYEGEGNINFNPVFAGTECGPGDLEIVLGSPAIDAGNPDPVYDDQCLPPGLGTERNDMGVTGGPANCGSLPPPSESNCFDGNDNDDDGLTDCADDDCAGATNGSCNTGLFGICSTGTNTCSVGVEECIQNEQPEPEVCNGIDDDCDGVQDGSENLTQECGTTDVGECSYGTESCDDSGNWVGCDAVLPATDVCDGKDNDCDAKTPDGSGESWYLLACDGPDSDLCKEGNFQCTDANQVCTDNTDDNDDSNCNGNDEDCNGIPDEDYVSTTTNCGTGVCSSTGLLECINGSEVDSCTSGEPTENPEVTCDDGLDNDCDGIVDCEECNDPYIEPNPDTQVSGVRDMVDITAPGVEFSVNIVIDVDESNAPSGLIVIENVPSTWLLTSSIPESILNDDTPGEIKWLFSDVDNPVIDTTISYNLYVPDTETIDAIRSFSGELKYIDADENDVTEQIAGDQCITIGYCHLYDADCDWCIGDFELLDAIDEWSKGNMGDFALLDLIDLWAGGCPYCWDTVKGDYISGEHDEIGVCVQPAD